MKSGDIVLCIDDGLLREHGLYGLPERIAFPKKGRTYTVISGTDSCGCSARILLSEVPPFISSQEAEVLYNTSRAVSCVACGKIIPRGDVGWGAFRFVKITDTDLKDEIKKEVDSDLEVKV